MHNVHFTADASLSELRLASYFTQLLEIEGTF